MVHLVDVHIVCDQCHLETGDRVEIADTFQVSFDHNTYELDLCETHLAAYQELQDLAVQHGRQLKRNHRKKAAPSKQAGASGPLDYPCQDCSKAFSSGQGLALHRRTAHEHTDIPCPECGRACRGLPGLLTHRRSHGIYSKEPEALAAVKAAEQRHGPEHLEAVADG